MLLSGTPVDAGEFPIPPLASVDTVRGRTVRAAVVAFGRLIGETLAHECGHALGLDHPLVDTPTVMDEASKRTFRDRTGIVTFIPATGLLVLFAINEFGHVQVKELRKILPVRL